MNWGYEKYDKDNNRMQYCPANDYDGSVTGHIVMGTKFWFDENPEERKRLGWVKHIYCEKEDLPEYNPLTQYLIKVEKHIDEYTIQDEYQVIEKSEEMLLLEEMLETMNIYVPSGKVILDDHGGVIV